jgi:hypothetical protein
MNFRKIGHGLFLTGLAFSLSAILYTARAENQTELSTEVDKRIALSLDEPARMLVLDRMRIFLVGLQNITDALSKKDMEQVAQVAESLGKKMTVNDHKVRLRGQLPETFRKHGGSLHKNFDLMAQYAKTDGNPENTLTQLSAVFAECVACHALYRFSDDEGQSQ